MHSEKSVSDQLMRATSFPGSSPILATGAEQERTWGSSLFTNTVQRRVVIFQGFSLLIIPYKMCLGFGGGVGKYKIIFKKNLEAWSTLYLSTCPQQCVSLAQMSRVTKGWDMMNASSKGSGAMGFYTLVGFANADVY